jgi:hypothetical protein
MSESIRQSNLFAAEDYKKIFKAYSFIDYTAYDFDTLKQALINYIKVYYPEDFNDYIESSEFIAIIELIAYLGTSLAFRTDLNSRENFIDTAERRESIIRLAQMVNYVPRRNIPASGLFKIASVQTDQPLTDANGININDTSIFWNDPNNPDWFDQFIQICNAAFSSPNPFGRPSKSGVIGSIPTDLYQLESVLQLAVTYSTNITVNGQQYPVDICNPDFVTNQTIFERDPDPANPFNFIYRNDSLGVSSANTGFFLYFKQGSLTNVDANFSFPVPNRVYPIDIQNINQDDVYVQETDQNGNVINKWKKVPALAGENIIYNSIQLSERNIFDVTSGANDTISVRFADGNFGNVPTGLFRFWVRTSANDNLVIRPEAAQGLQINIPYIGSDNQQYTLRITFNLEQTVSNAAPSETNDQIRLRAPEVFSTQSRMVNGSDYNVLPLVYGNQIAKIQALDRTYSGQSRYIDINDPTGFHRDLVIFGQDGALYRDDENILKQATRNSSNAGNFTSNLINIIQEMLRDDNVSMFFYDEYLTQFEEKIRVNPPGVGRSLLELTDNTAPLYWRTSPLKFKNNTGYFVNSTNSGASAVGLVNNISTANVNGDTYDAWGFITTGAVLEFAKPTNLSATNTVAVSNIIQNGIPLNLGSQNSNPYSEIGPVELSLEETNNYQATKVYPAFRTTLTNSEIAAITAAIESKISFWLYYDLLSVDSTTGQPGKWGVSSASSITSPASQSFVYPVPPNVGSQPGIYSDWGVNPLSGILYVNITTDAQTAVTTFNMTARGRAHVFESYKDVRFYWEPGQTVIDSASGQALQDTIEIMPFVNTNNTINNNNPNVSSPQDSFIKNPVTFNISGIYVQDDGYLDTSKVKVGLPDINGDGVPDAPGGFDNIVSTSDLLVFEYYTDELTGYQSTRPWVANWGLDLIEELPSAANQIPLSDPTGAIIGYASNIKPTADSTGSYTMLTDAAGSFIGYIRNTSGYFMTKPITDSATNANLLGYVFPSLISQSTDVAEDQLYVYFPISPIDPTTLYSAPYIANRRLTDNNEILEPGLVTTSGFRFVYLDSADLIFISKISQIALNTSYGANTISNQVTAFFNNDVSTFPWLAGINLINNKADILNTYFFNKSFQISTISKPGYGVYYALTLSSTNDTATYPTGYIIDGVVDQYHYDKNGKVFTQNTSVVEESRIPMYFKWSHYSPIDQRIDPAPSNIIDMVVITNAYYNDMIIWKNSNGTAATKPVAPTTEELRVLFQDLNQYKMISDSMIWNSGNFKVLFGSQASAELQATFKVVKAPSASISDNEIKIKVIEAIDTYFDIRNWDFGEKFFYTELAAFIHQQLSRIISSVVIVPNNSSSQFGDLFEIVATPVELFISTATVDNVQIISNLTPQTLRV